VHPAADRYRLHGEDLAGLLGGHADPIDQHERDPLGVGQLGQCLQDVESPMLGGDSGE
jgi:hypothetical protein